MKQAQAIKCEPQNRIKFTESEWEKTSAALKVMLENPCKPKRTVKSFVDEHSDLIILLRNEGYTPRQIAEKINESVNDKFNVGSLVSLIYTIKKDDN